MVEPNEPAPAFELPDQDGNPVSLDDYAGQRIILYFYPRADTPGCTTEATEFRDNWDEYADHDTVILGVSDDPVDDIKPFHDKHDLPFPLLSDEDGTVSTAYDSYGEKNMFGRTFDGVYRNTVVIGPDGTIEAVYTNVTPDGHAKELLADLT